jgi:4-amino-4-deoxy-L-arabinose transferase-like glycosyltransferase
MNPAKYLKRPQRRTTAIYSVLSLCLLFLMLYKLGSLTNGVSSAEAQVYNLKLGLHGLYHNPLYLPLNFLRSIDFRLFTHHSAFLLRLPDAIMGILTVISFSALVYLWHGKRTAYYASIMFAVSAWVLHVSRLASFDIVYLWAITSCLLAYVCLSEFEGSKLAWYLNLFLLGILVTIPGLIWLAFVLLYFEKDVLKSDQKKLSLPGKVASFLLLIIWLPLVIYRAHINHTFRQWLGLPQHFPSVLHFIKNMVAVPVHLLIRGPLYPNLWLGKAPVLDFFAVIMLLIGVYTYAQHRKNSRTQLLGSLTLLSIFLIGLNGAVSFSLIIPLAYLFIAMGLSYIVHSWRKVFPKNPVAKWVSLVLVILAITLSCAYNLRAYFIAWPHNSTTYTTFDQIL